METISLAAKAREKTTAGGLSQLRKSGRVPAVIYGLDNEPKPIDLDGNELNRCLRMDNKNQVLELDIEGQKEVVIVKEISWHPIKQNKVLHLDFIRVNDVKPVKVKVPIKHEGIPAGVKNEGGQFVIMKRFVVVKGKITDIPESFVQDVSDLSLDTVVYAGDIDFPKGTILTPPKTALYGVTASRVTEEPQPVATAEEGEEGAEPEEGKEPGEASEASKAEGSKDSEKPGEKPEKSK